MLDIEYKNELAGQLGVGIDNLKSICGREELKELLTDPDIYDENFLSEDLFINLHAHTTFSDGLLHADELLEEALAHAEKIDHKVWFSCTDLNTVKGNIDIIKAIAADPVKYSKISFIPGCLFVVDDRELNLKYKVLVYGINPFKPFDDVFKFGSRMNSLKQSAKVSIKELADYLSLYQKSSMTCLAHPKKLGITKGALSALIMKLKEGLRLRALETYYLYNKGPKDIPGESFVADTNEAMMEIENLANMHELLKTGGVDSHGKSFSSRFSYTKDSEA